MSFIHKSMSPLVYCLPIFTGLAHADAYVNTTGGTVAVSGNGVVIINGKVVSGDAVTASGPEQTEERSVPPYNDIQIDAPVQMTYEVSDTRALKVTAPANVLPLLSTSVVDGRLTVDLKGSVVSLNDPIRVDASGPSPRSVTLSGAGSANFMNLSGPAVTLNVNGSSKIVATGSVTQLTASISGSGRLDASLLHAEEINLSASGAANVSAFASRSIAGDISGASRAIIAGAPARRKAAVSGAAKIAYR